MKEDTFMHPYVLGMITHINDIELHKEVINEATLVRMILETLSNMLL